MLDTCSVTNQFEWTSFTLPLIYCDIMRHKIINSEIESCNLFLGFLLRLKLNDLN